MLPLSGRSQRVRKISYQPASPQVESIRRLNRNDIEMRLILEEGPQRQHSPFESCYFQQ